MIDESNGNLVLMCHIKGTCFALFVTPSKKLFNTKVEKTGIGSWSIHVDGARHTTLSSRKPKSSLTMCECNFSMGNN